MGEAFDFKVFEIFLHTFLACSWYQNGLKIPEASEHILLECPFYNTVRKSICKLCESMDLNVSQQTFLTEKRLQLSVEKLLRSFLDNDIAD